MPKNFTHFEARQASRNPLLVQDDVGRAAPTCRDLPKFGFAYGKCHLGDVEGAKEIVSDWVTHNPSTKRAQHSTNHIRKNAVAISQQSAKSTRGKAATDIPNLPTDVKPDHCFGIQNRPSTPIGAVVEYQFGAEYEKHANAMFAENEEVKRSTGTKFHPKMTKAAEGHALGAEKRILARQKKDEGNKEEFKLSKFKNVKSTFQVPKVPKGTSAEA